MHREIRELDYCFVAVQHATGAVRMEHLLEFVVKRLGHVIRACNIRA